VVVGGVLAGGAWLPVEAPRSHMSLERGLKGQDQLLKFLQRETGQIQHLQGAGLEIGAS
jgi:hypothetical protein